MINLIILKLKYRKIILFDDYNDDDDEDDVNVRSSGGDGGL